LNAETENTSDLCAENPKITAFREWYEGFDVFPDNECSGSYAETSVDGLYHYYVFRGGCDFATAMTVDFIQTQAFWDNVILSEGAVLQATGRPDSQGIVSK